ADDGLGGAALERQARAVGRAVFRIVRARQPGPRVGEHRLVEVGGHDRPAPAEPLDQAPRDDAGAAGDLQHAHAVAHGQPPDEVGRERVEEQRGQIAVVVLRDLADERGGGVGHPRQSFGVQPLKRSRSTFLPTFPTLVFGTASMSTTSSGSANFASRGRRYSTISRGSSVMPGLGTTQARGRSTHFGCGTAMTAASSTLGWSMIIVSTSMDEIHSPPDLMRSLVRSVICTYPSGSMDATSPVRNQPSAVNRSTDSGLS